MKRKAISGIMLTLLLIGMLTLAFNIQPVKSDWAWTETIYIRADGSIAPPTAPISSIDYITYTLTNNIVGDVPLGSSMIVVERDNIVIDGGGHMLIGPYWEGFGIKLSYRSNITVRNTEFRGFRGGIYSYYSSAVKIFGNTMTGNAGGVDLVGSNNTIISGNNMYSNGRPGGVMVWEYCYNNIISGNNIMNNLDGIMVGYSHNNIISGNNITNNSENGIFLGHNVYSSGNNVIYENNITNNGYGVYISSLGDKFYHNNFIANTIQAYVYQFDPSLTNTWDDGYPSGGNYWSDYEERYHDAEELDDSGIWDTPYIIDVDNQDRYPLMKPYAFDRVPEVPEWQRLDTPFSDMLYGGPLCVAIDPLNPQIVYVGIKWGTVQPKLAGPGPRHIRIGGVYRSEDGGETWAYKGQGFLHPYKFWKRIPSIGALAIDPINPEIIYAASISGEGMWKSNDRGETWTQINNGLPRLWRWFGGYPAFTALAVSTSSPNVLYIGSGSANLPGIFKSVDGGESWSNVYVVENIMEEFVQVHSIAIDSTSPDIVYAAIEINGVGTIIKSADGGSSWATLATLPAQTLAISPVSPQRLYAGATDGNIYESTDAGNTWHRKEVTDHPITALVISQVMPDWIFAGTGKTIERCGGSGIYASFDSGQNWRAVNGGLDTLDAACGRLDPTGIYVPINCLATSGISSIRIFVTTDKGIYRITINLSE